MPIRRLKRVVSNITGPGWKNQSRGLTIGRELGEFRKVFKDNFVGSVKNLMDLNKNKGFVKFYG